MAAEKKEKEGKGKTENLSLDAEKKETKVEGAKTGPATEKEKSRKEKKEVKILGKESERTHRIVRVLEYTLNGDKKVSAAIRDIKGIGHRIAAIVARKLNMENKLLSELDENEISQLENTLKNINTIVPPWMVNHRNDQFTGLNLHLIGTDLEIGVKNDIEFMEKIKCYKGIRHMQGQPVRGQRTRTSFRTGKTVGVIKKKEAPAKAGAKEEAGKKTEKAAPPAKK